MNIDQYTTLHTSPDEALLNELVRYTHLHTMSPRMLSGRLQGRLLTMFSAMLQPRRILEIGTFTGYATLCLAKGLAHGGEIHTIERNDELQDSILSFFKRSPQADSIKLHIGDALDIIPELHDTFDLVYIDGDKREYTQYYHAVFDKVRHGGFIIADNVLWDGKVLDKPAPNDAQTQNIIQFNNLVHDDPRVENLLLPVRDGLLIAQKK
ncbi:MAG: O-methyltransferase [Prevotellaceae bacterium]|jgi:predicted O-methyltransferase YrrM|nr:O-methyltransferase [Prevotellaceae bacterium]